MAQLPTSLTRVTRFSKILALLLILAFIGSAFYAGVAFDSQYHEFFASTTPTPTPAVPTAQTTCQTDSDCVIASINAADLCCPNTKCINLASASSVAVNTQWLISQRQNVCGRKLCPMYAVMCTREITQENAHYHAKCVQHVCQKVRS